MALEIKDYHLDPMYQIRSGGVADKANNLGR